MKEVEKLTKIVKSEKEMKELEDGFMFYMWQKTYDNSYTKVFSKPGVEYTLVKGW